jgi:hypothetical protein
MDHPLFTAKFRAFARGVQGAVIVILKSPATNPAKPEKETGAIQDPCGRMLDTYPLAFVPADSWILTFVRMT